ncbi:MAG: tRNA 2-thiouridine(34) synthase MnmA [Candidatus Ventricola sp.]
MARIVVGMSGGVDSSVAALLLKRQGHEVIGVFMKNWEEKDANGVCTSESDWADVRAVCERIDIPYYSVNFAKEYADRVFSYFLSEYRRGRTPNPDVLCNREIKFKAFLDFAMELGADALATGHFCRLGDAPDGRRLLLRGADANKDQSYFLYMLGQHALERAMFPVGGLSKAQVREIAAEAGLATSGKKDSTGVCFIGERRFKPFLQQFLPAQPGDMRTLDGRVVGRHDGLMYYTLGQRRGLGIGGVEGGGADGGRWFVLAKDMERNELIVAQGADHPLLYSRNAIGEEATWIAGEAPGSEFDCTCRYRYRQPDQRVHVQLLDGGRVRVTAQEPQRAVTPGQSMVFYQGEACLGGAVCCEVLDSGRVSV